METPLRTVVWRNLVWAGAEYCSLFRVAEGWLLRGHVVAAADAQTPIHAEYEIRCDEYWNTTSVDVTRNVGGARNWLHLVCHESRWRAGGEQLEALHGCTDVDLGLSPATNTLPIRRLNLRVGESRDVKAVWIRFPHLTIETLHQTYTRIADDRYRYASATEFSAEIVVDDLGLVVHYPPAWERVATR